jgi:hypothetical protein
MTIHFVGDTPSYRVDAADILEAAQSAAEHFGDGMRADSLDAQACHSARRMFRRTVDRIALDIHRNEVDHKGRALPIPSESRCDAVAVALARAAGYSVDADGVTHDSFRADASSYLTRELTDRNGVLHRPRPRKRAFVDALPTRTVDPAMQLFETAYVEEEGEATLLTPGTTQIGRVDAKVGEKERRLATIGTVVEIGWMEALHGTRSSINKAALKAASAARLLMRKHEDFCISGIPGISDVWSLQNIPYLGKIKSSVDYSAGPSLSDIYTDMVSMINKLQQAHEERNSDGPNTLFIASDWARALTPANNFSAGGSMTGVQLRQELASLFEGAGISQFISCPALNRWKGSATQSAAVLARLDGSEGLHKVVAMTPSPVRTHQTLISNQTLWAMRFGLLDSNDMTGTALLTAKTR